MRIYQTQFFLQIYHQHVTGASIHAPRQRNSTYVQTVRQSIYETKWPYHPHSPIRQYWQLPQGPPLWPRYMESCPFHKHATSTTTYTSKSMAPCISAAVTITASTELLRQETAHHRIRYMTLAPSSASTFLLVTGFDLIWLTIFNLIRLNCCFDLIRLNYYYLIWFDSRLMYLFLTRVTQFESHSSQASGRSTWPGCLQKIPTLKLWNIPQFWSLKLGLARTL